MEVNVQEGAALSITEACSVARMGRTRLYELLRTGELIGRKNGKRTLILRSDLQRWLESLPAIEPKP